VLASLGFTWWTGNEAIDPAIGLGLSLYMVWCGWRILRETLHALLDQELSEADRKRIEQAVLACTGVHNLHDLRTRNAGDRLFIEFHLEVDGKITVNDGHVISEAVENAVLDLYPTGAEVLTHLEPAGIDDERLDKRILRPARAGG
jgi:cation diffusion facilitator family transporter